MEYTPVAQQNTVQKSQEYLIVTQIVYDLQNALQQFEKSASTTFHRPTINTTFEDKKAHMHNIQFNRNTVASFRLDDMHSTWN